MIRRLPISTLFPYTTLFRSALVVLGSAAALLEKLGKLFVPVPPPRWLPNVAAPIPLSPHLLWANKSFLALSELERLPPERSEEHTSELQSLTNVVCRLLLEK